MLKKGKKRVFFAFGWFQFGSENYLTSYTIFFHIFLQIHDKEFEKKYLSLDKKLNFSLRDYLSGWGKCHPFCEKYAMYLKYIKKYIGLLQQFLCMVLIILEIS